MTIHVRFGHLICVRLPLSLSNLSFEFFLCAQTIVGMCFMIYSSGRWLLQILIRWPKQQHIFSIAVWLSGEAYLVPWSRCATYGTWCTRAFGCWLMAFIQCHQHVMASVALETTVLQRIQGTLANEGEVHLAAPLMPWKWIFLGVLPNHAGCKKSEWVWMKPTQWQVLQKWGSIDQTELWQKHLKHFKCLHLCRIMRGFLLHSLDMTMRPGWRWNHAPVLRDFSLCNIDISGCIWYVICCFLLLFFFDYGFAMISLWFLNSQWFVYDLPYLFDGCLMNV